MTTTYQPTPFYLRRLMSLLGIIPVGAFVVEHAFTNSLAFFYGFEEWNEAVIWLTSLPFILFMEIFLIGIPILLHAAIGIYIWVFCEPNIQHYGYLRNWFYTLQRWTGIVALVFIVFHVYKLRIEWLFTTDMTHIEAEYVAAYFHELWHVIFYFIGITAVCFHFGNGLWNFLIKWGFAVGDQAQRWAGVVCGAVGLAVYLFFLTSLYAFSTTPIG